MKALPTHANIDNAKDVLPTYPVLCNVSDVLFVTSFAKWCYSPKQSQDSAWGYD